MRCNLVGMSCQDMCGREAASCGLRCKDKHVGRNDAGSMADLHVTSSMPWLVTPPQPSNRRDRERLAGRKGTVSMIMRCLLHCSNLAALFLPNIH